MRREVGREIGTGHELPRTLGSPRTEPPAGGMLAVAFYVGASALGNGRGEAATFGAHAPVPTIDVEHPFFDAKLLRFVRQRAGRG